MYFCENPKISWKSVPNPCQIRAKSWFWRGTGTEKHQCWHVVLKRWSQNTKSVSVPNTKHKFKHREKSQKSPEKHKKIQWFRAFLWIFRPKKRKSDNKFHRNKCFKLLSILKQRKVSPNWPCFRDFLDFQSKKLDFLKFGQFSPDIQIRGSFCFFLLGFEHQQIQRTLFLCLKVKISLRTTQKNAQHNTRVRNTPTLE